MISILYVSFVYFDNIKHPSHSYIDPPPLLYNLLIGGGIVLCAIMCCFMCRLCASVMRCCRVVICGWWC